MMSANRRAAISSPTFEPSPIVFPRDDESIVAGDDMARPDISHHRSVHRDPARAGDPGTRRARHAGWPNGGIGRARAALLQLLHDPEQSAGGGNGARAHRAPRT